MTGSRTRLLALALALGFALPAAADAGFDARLTIARQNLASESGAAYDRRLGDALAALPAIRQASDECLRRHPGDQALQGYFHLTTATSYLVVLAPASPFATCLGGALQGQSLPAPPSLPWFNHFSFRYTAPAAASTP